MPDALSKTVPIWCLVINRLLFPEETHALHTPDGVVSASEHAQMEARVNGFVAEAEVCGDSMVNLVCLADGLVSWY